MSHKIPLAALALAVCGAAAAQTAPTVDDLAQKNTAARGGLDKIRAIQSLKITGKMVMMNGMELPLTMYIKRPGLTRMEMDFQGRSIVQAFDGTDTWMVNPLTGSGEPQKAPEEESKRARETSEMMFDGYLADYKNKGVQVELIGKEDVEGSPAYKLKLTTKGGHVIYSFLDAESFLDVKAQAKVKQMGQEMDVESYPGSYKPVAGVMTAHSLEQRVAGKPLMKMDFQKVEANVEIDDKIFQFPAKPAPAPPAEKKQ